MSDRSRTDDSLTKSGLIESLARNQSHLPAKDVELAVKSLLERMSREMANGERIEIRGFGSFNLHFREPRIGRNPKSGDAVALRGKHVPHFKPGKELRERVDGKCGGPSRPGATGTAAHGVSPDEGERGETPNADDDAAGDAPLIGTGSPTPGTGDDRIADTDG